VARVSPWTFAIAAAVVAALVAAVVLAYRSTRPLELKGHGRRYTFARRRVSAAAPSSAAPEVPAFDVAARLRALGAAVGAFFAVLLARLWGMQLLSSSDYSAQAEQNLTRDVSTSAPRGRIFDRSGVVLVDNRLSYALVAEKDVADDTRLVRRISNLLGMPEVAVRHNVQSTSEGAQSLRTVMIDVPEAAVAYVAEHPGMFPGVSIEARSVRSYPFGSTACHLLGYTGSISSDELAAYAADESNTIDYQLGDVVGKAGIEYQYEAVLQGVRGVRTVHVNASGDVTGTVSEVDPVPGSDVRLTVDVTVQQAAESAVLTSFAASEYLGYKPTGAAVTCMNCKTGEILAMASYPSYDPTSFIGGISADVWAQLIADDANTPLLNRAIDGLYPSASTIKPLTACAALESGLTTTEATVECTGWWTGFGEAYGMHCWNHSGHGVMNLREGIVNSCDTVFYEIASAAYYSSDPEVLQEMFRRWGLGSKTGVDLPGEAAGRVPDAEWKWNWFTSSPDESRAWQGGDTANIAIGQGDILVTPLQMCCVYCGLVNGGVEMRPHLMKDVLSSETHDALVVNPQTVARTVQIDPSLLSFVQSGMWGVVNETYISSYFAGLPVEVMGKSGTGEAGDDDTNTHAWFVAAAPYDDPTYVVAALIEHGGGGGYVASNACREVLGAIYGVEMTDPVSILQASGATAGVSD
jgi:penicillin-binding protein 2